MTGPMYFNSEALARLRLVDERAAALVTGGMSQKEAYMRVYCEMEHEAWAAAEQIKLKDIRENGT